MIRFTIRVRIRLSGAGDDAAAGDAIYVHGGNCYENVDVDKPRLTLVSSIIEFVPA